MKDTDAERWSFPSTGPGKRGRSFEDTNSDSRERHNRKK